MFVSSLAYWLHSFECWNLLNIATFLSFPFVAAMDGQTGTMWQKAMPRKQPGVLPSSCSQRTWNGLMITTLSSVLKTTTGILGFRSSGSIGFTADLKVIHRRATSTTAPVRVSGDANKIPKQKALECFRPAKKNSDIQNIARCIGQTNALSHWCDTPG